ncbi:hypothetical protein HYFRA_00013382 [Hymenoscyphus fraxineus]|uniref:Uncharacterized protein n=1 Tax=Hymenoscyphus fraxineus TaxID=746836 RepID=A0A9N9PN97_9HELO|nr:hypothetical protein HYFRA_00013382 [Hymenoscyphus fraxineus]
MDSLLFCKNELDVCLAPLRRVLLISQTLGKLDCVHEKKSPCSWDIELYVLGKEEINALGSAMEARWPFEFDEDDREGMFEFGDEKASGTAKSSPQKFKFVLGLLLELPKMYGCLAIGVLKILDVCSFFLDCEGLTRRAVEHKSICEHQRKRGLLLQTGIQACLSMAHRKFHATVIEE